MYQQMDLVRNLTTSAHRITLKIRLQSHVARSKEFHDNRTRNSYRNSTIVTHDTERIKIENTTLRSEVEKYNWGIYKQAE